jgi:hypothetical protein
MEGAAPVGLLTMRGASSSGGTTSLAGGYSSEAAEAAGKAALEAEVLGAAHLSDETPLVMTPLALAILEFLEIELASRVQKKSSVISPLEEPAEAAGRAALETGVLGVAESASRVQKKLSVISEEEPLKEASVVPKSMDPKLLARMLIGVSLICNAKKTLTDAREGRGNCNNVEIGKALKSLGREFSQISANSQEFREEIVLLIIGRLGDNDAFVRGSAIAALGIIVANNQEYQAELVPLIERSLDG